MRQASPDLRDMTHKLTYRMVVVAVIVEISQLASLNPAAEGEIV
jgi:hypothetical protein